LDSLEKREFAGKKANLAAAELAKLSRRVGGELFNLQFQVSVLVLMDTRLHSMFSFVHN